MISWGGKGSRVLIMILVIFIIIDIFLFALFFLNKPRTLLKFHSSTGVYNLAQGDFKFIGQDKTLMLVNGYIDGSPAYSATKESLILPISFYTKGGQQIRTNAKIGVKGELFALFVKNGLIGSVEDWRRISLSNLVSALKKDYPIIVRFSIKKTPAGIINDSDCNASCKEYYQEMNSNIDGNLRFFKAYQEEQNVNSELDIGPADAVFIYE